MPGEPDEAGRGCVVKIQAAVVVIIGLLLILLTLVTCGGPGPTPPPQPRVLIATVAASSNKHILVRRDDYGQVLPDATTLPAIGSHIDVVWTRIAPGSGTPTPNWSSIETPIAIVSGQMVRLADGTEAERPLWVTAPMMFAQGATAGVCDTFVPAWAQAGAAYYNVGGQNVPRYDSLSLMAAYSETIKQIGIEYNGDERIAGFIIGGGYNNEEWFTSSWCHVPAATPTPGGPTMTPFPITATEMGDWTINAIRAFHQYLPDKPVYVNLASVETDATRCRVTDEIASYGAGNNIGIGFNGMNPDAPGFVEQPATPTVVPTWVAPTPAALNVSPTAGRFQPAMACMSGTDCLMVWQDKRNDPSRLWINGYGMDNNGDIYGVRVDPETGVALGSEFVIEGVAQDEQWPAVIYNPTEGDYVVAWQEVSVSATVENWNQFEYCYDIKARRVTHDGVPAGTTMTVSDAVDCQWVPQLAWDSGGGKTLVTWHDHRYRTGMPRTPNPQTEKEIFGQRLEYHGSDLVLSGSDFPLTVSGEATPAPRNQQYSSAWMADGIAHVCWSDNRSTSGTPEPFDIYCQSLVAEQTGGLSNVAVEENAGTQEKPRVARDSAGNTWVTWQGYQTPAPFPNPGTTNVKAMRLNASLTPVSPAFMVAGDTALYPLPDVACTDNGVCVVAWGGGAGLKASRYTYQQVALGAGTVYGSRADEIRAVGIEDRLNLIFAKDGVLYASSWVETPPTPVPTPAPACGSLDIVRNNLGAVPVKFEPAFTQATTVPSKRQFDYWSWLLALTARVDFVDAQDGWFCGADGCPTPVVDVLNDVEAAPDNFPVAFGNWLEQQYGKTAATTQHLWVAFRDTEYPSDGGYCQGYCEGWTGDFEHYLAVTGGGTTHLCSPLAASTPYPSGALSCGAAGLPFPYTRAYSRHARQMTGATLTIGVRGAYMATTLAGVALRVAYVDSDTTDFTISYYDGSAMHTLTVDRQGTGDWVWATWPDLTINTGIDLQINYSGAGAKPILHMVWMDLTGATGTADTPTPTPTGGVGVFTPTPTPTSWPATTVTCANMTGLVTLDGDLTEWDGVEEISVNKDTSAIVTPLPGPLASDAQARVKCGWDADYLYLAAVLDDDAVVADSQFPWLDDSLEVGIDAGNDAIPWGPDDHEWSVRANGEVLLFNRAEAPGVMVYAATAAGGGGGEGVEGAAAWQIEMRIERGALGVNQELAVGKRMRFTVGLNDDDDGGGRDHLLIWRGRSTLAASQEWAGLVLGE